MGFLRAGLGHVFNLVLKGNANNYPKCTMEGLPFWGYKDEKTLNLLSKSPQEEGMEDGMGARRVAQTDLAVSRVSLCRCPPAPASPRRV